MPFNGEKQCVSEDQQSDSESSRFAEGVASLSDYECSRQSFTSDSSSKSSSPASTSPPRGLMFDDVMAAAKNLSDMMNFVIRNIRPHIQHHLVEYERNKFQEVVEETPNALSQTTEWLKESIDKELLSETDVAPAAEHSSTPSLSPLLVLNNCYLKLLQWDYQKKVLPETLMTDGPRLQELSEKLNQLKMTACVALITNNMVGAVTEGLPELANRLKRISAVLLEGMNKETFNLKEALHSIGVQTCAEVNKALEERGSPTLNAEVQANLVGQLSSLEEKDNPVCTLMDKRIQLYMVRFHQWHWRCGPFSALSLDCIRVTW